jgi:RNA polymerase sigma factor (sigma-70 family)
MRSQRGCCENEQVRALAAVSVRDTAWSAAVMGEKAVSGGEAEPTPSAHMSPAEADASAFANLFRDAYQALLRDAIFAGGNYYEAEDAVSAALEEVLRRWDKIENPRAYARKAAISNLIKNKQRGQQRIRARMIQRGDYQLERDLDPGLTVWEEQEWVMQLLESLPTAQREVLACIIDMFPRKEIAQLLGKTDAAVRQNLCAARKSLMSYLAEAGTAKAPAHPTTARGEAR